MTAFSETKSMSQQPKSECPTSASGEYVISPTEDTIRQPNSGEGFVGFGLIGFETYLASIVRDEDVFLALPAPTNKWNEI